VAALVGCDLKTVKAWLKREQRGEDRPQRPRATDAFLLLIRQKVGPTQGKTKSKPLLRVLRTAGDTRLLASAPRALKDVRQEWSREHRRIHRPWISAPGEVLLVDWAEVGTIATPEATASCRACAPCWAGVAGSTCGSLLGSVFRCCQGLAVLQSPHLAAERADATGCATPPK
jgi:hypothetical protein